MSKYTGEFTSITGKDYKILIETETGDKTENIILSESPFVTSMDSDGDTIYSPIKCTGATISLITKDMPLDLYSGSAMGTKVSVTSGSEIIWKGFLTPCAYDMGFDKPHETVELECVDGISVLKNYPYTTDLTDVRTFLHIIFTCLKVSNIYKNLYVTDNVQLTSASANDSIIEKFRISEQNFFDEKDDINQLDADVAWNCYDVLFELMQYLGYNMFADGEDVYIIDYDAIKRGNNKYFRYDISGNSPSSPVTVTKSYSYDVKEGSYAESGSKVSLDMIYNKVSVKDDFYTFDTLFQFPDINFENNITSKNQDTLLPSSNYILSDIITDTVGLQEETYQFCVAQGWRGRLWVCIFKFYDSGFLSFEKYSNTTSRANISTQFENAVKLSDLINNHGAYYVRYFKKDLTWDEYNKWKANYPNFNSMTVTQRKEAWVKLINKKPEGVDFSPIIICTNLPTNHIGPAALQRTGKYDETDDEDCRRYPYIKLKGNYNANILGGENAYVIISADWSYHDESNTPFPLSNGADNSKLSKEGDLKHANQGFVWSRFKWGENYWDGSAWVSNPTDFKLWFWDLEKDRNGRKNKDTFDKDYPLLDTASAKFAASENGYYIPAPQNGNLNGTVDFIIYANRDMRGYSRRGHWHPDAGNYYSRYYQYVTFFKDLKIKAYIANGFLDDKEIESDTIYTNVLNNNSVEELEEITFKVCTFDNKKPNYSSVDYLSNNVSHYVCKTYNKALNSLESGSKSAYDGKTGLTQEEHLIFKLVNQYQNPKVIYDCSLHNEDHKLFGLYTLKSFTGKKFIASEINTDFRRNKSEIKFIEKF